MGWIPTITEWSGPVYKRIVAALEADVASGRLARGQQLPTHRALARALGIDLTTVTRAYGEARRRGLLDARVGQGTFVSETTARAAADIPYQVKIDLSMNVPPQPVEANLETRIAQGLGFIQNETGFTALLNYQRPGGSDEETRDRRQVVAAARADGDRRTLDSLSRDPGGPVQHIAVADISRRRGADRGAHVSRNQGGGRQTQRASCRRGNGRRGD
jgi:DNA-binding transcriptional regulator YhcF (GntR family)